MTFVLCQFSSDLIMSYDHKSASARNPRVLMGWHTVTDGVLEQKQDVFTEGMRKPSTDPPQPVLVTLYSCAA
jgi:hypothetical protein